MAQATINPGAEGMALRNVGRIKTLRAAIEKAQARGQAERAGSLQGELDRRMTEVNALRAELDSL